MSRTLRYVFPGLLIAALLVVLPLVAQKGAVPSQWLSYSAESGSTGYSAADLINRDNVKNLQIAWSWKFDNFGATSTEVTPIMVNGILYFPLSPRRTIVAADAGTGETLWTWRPPQDERETRAARTYARGVGYWKDGDEERIVTITPGFRLVALNLKTGTPVPTFGTNGVVDLFEALDLDFSGDIIGRIGNSSPPVISNGVIVVGPALTPNAPSYKNVKGDVMGFDARTGKKLWVFHTIPRKGEFGYETWLNNSADYSGNAGVWGPFSADDELGYVYLSVEDATNDFYGGHRQGSNLFSNSLVCVDIKTGKRIWHQQLVHHDIWDYDMPAAPILLNINVDGRPVKAVVQTGKQGFAYVFDRTNGQPVWPMPETPVKQTDVPGEWTSPTQPFPTKPAAIEVQGVTENDLVDFTPEIKTEALRVARQFRLGGLYTPASLPNAADGSMGTLTAPSASGGVNWPGGAIDPVDDVLYVASQTTLFRAQLSAGSPKTGVLYHDTRGQSLSPSATVFGLPLIKPPYGRVTAVDLKTGERLWMVPHGNTPDSIRRNPKLQGVEIPNTGAQTRGTGLLVTSTLLFGGEGGFTPVLRAWDKKTGAVVAEIQLPGPTTGFPVTYTKAGRQYIAVAARVGDAVEIVALALETPASPTGRGQP